VALTEGDAGSGPSGLKRPTKAAAAAALACLGVACALVAVNASSSDYLLVLGAEVFSAAALGLGLVSLSLGLAHLLPSRPDLRRPVIFLVLVCLALLGAHLYIINSPATYTPGGPLVGPVGEPFSDSNILVSSHLSGSTLFVNATDVGSNAISSVTLSVGNLTLSPSGFTGAPTPDFPLQPQSATSSGFRDSVIGAWTIPRGNPATINASYQYLTCYHVPDQSDERGVFGCVMDETYYVPAAQTLLAGTQCSTSVPNCNLEHPFLSKAIIAAGIAIFGLDGFGWRIFTAVLGTLSVPLLFVLAYLVSGNRKLSYFATGLFALDTLFFAHSSAALIDVPAVFFSLLGFIFYFWRASYRSVDHLVVAGIFFGLAALTKETAVFLLAAVVTYEWISGGREFKSSILRSLRVAIPAVFVFMVGLQVYDTLFTSGSFPYFYQQVEYILSYGAGLKGPGWVDTTLHTPITPLNWLTFYSPVGYLVTTVTVNAGSSSYQYVGVGYWGVANVVVVWMVFLWVPLALYGVIRARRQAVPQRDVNFALLMVVWFLWTYVPYVLLWLYGRVTYPFYLVPAIPALASGAAYVTTREWFPYLLALAYVAFAGFFFFLYFPVKDFLPVYLRTLLRW